MAKGTPRNAAQAILSQAANPEPVRAAADEAERAATATRATTGVKAGLKPGETRVTCIVTDDQNRVLHDWAKTTGRSFREVTLAMADAYIEGVIKPATSGEHKLIRWSDPPEAYADMYEATPDEWAQFF